MLGAVLLENIRHQGGELFPINLANELVERGYDVSLLVLDPSVENLRVRGLVKPQIPIYERPLVDDASTDGTRELVERLAPQLDIPVVTAFNETRSGNVFKQWEKGISLARGDLVWICESDDFAELNFLSRLAPYFADPSITIAFGRIQFADERGELDTWLEHSRAAMDA